MAFPCWRGGIGLYACGNGRRPPGDGLPGAPGARRTTRIEALEAVLPVVVTRLRSVPDAETRGRLLTALIALLPEEEMIANGRETDPPQGIVLDTPYLCRMREEGREEGREAVQTIGALIARRRSILETLAWRFNPPVLMYQQVERFLETITDETQLAQLLAVAIQSESMADFQAALGQEHRQNAPK